MAGVSERIRRVRSDLAPAERRVVEALLADYPMAGLGSVSRLARAAGVSARTVLRLLAKLGFSGYPDFREEVAARLFSPVDVYPDGDGTTAPARAERLYADAVLATFRGLDEDEFTRAVALLADPAATVLVAGGRFSATLATRCRAPAAHEFTFSPLVGLAAADAMLLFRAGVKQVARRMGLHATFICPLRAAQLLRQRLAPAPEPDQVLRKSALDRGALGDGFVDWLLGLKDFEIGRFTESEGAWDAETVSDWEHREYFGQY
jgi:Helix-turn-helix domain, rpiR family/Glutamine synthetase, catalytic domain